MNSTRKTFAVLSMSALVAAGAAQGAVLYTPVNITISPGLAEEINLDLNQAGEWDFYLSFGQWSGYWPTYPIISSIPWVATGTGAVLSASADQGLPLTAAGTMIDGSYESAQPLGWFYYGSTGFYGSTGALVGGWTKAGNNEGYVGLELTDGAVTKYGWAHVIYNATGVPLNNLNTGTLTLVDAAMETAPGVGILAGQTAETGAPTIAVPPSSQTGYPGGTAQLTVIATGFPAPGFQWRAGAVNSGIYTNLPNGAGVTDGAMNTLTLQNLKLGNMADYVVVVSNSYGSVTSSIPATLTVLPASDFPAILVHRYSFQDTAGSSTFADSVGGPDWDGTLQGSATLTGSSLQLDGSSGCYASLPPNIMSNYTQMTVEFWADIGSNPEGAHVFSFGEPVYGNLGYPGFYYSPCDGDANGYQNLLLVEVTGVDLAWAYNANFPALTNTTGNHITVIVDTVNDGLCYYNGASVASTLLFGSIGGGGESWFPSLAGINDVDNWIGASLNPDDPYLAGTVYEFRIYQGVLSPQAIALHDAAGPAKCIELSANPTISASLSGGNIVLSWPASDFGFSVQSSPDLTSWTTLGNVPALVGTNWQVSLPATGTPQFFQLVH